MEFNDGSTATISGQATLIVSEHEQKNLRLAEGSLSARVVPQPDGRPMLIHTPVAALQVLGTTFDVIVEPATTTLIVTEGTVRATRLSDRNSVEVPADHQVIATIGTQKTLRIVRLSDSVNTWKSNLPTDILHGEWLPELGGQVTGLRATPQIRQDGKQKPTVIYLAAASIPREPPVVLSSGAELRIRGKTDSPADLTIGLTVRHPIDGFAGKYAATLQAARLSPTGGFFDLEVPLKGFVPDHSQFSDSLVDLELCDWWCSTVTVDAGLSIFAVELAPAENKQPNPQ